MRESSNMLKFFPLNIFEDAGLEAETAFGG
jgi:hypothetical protein